MAFNAVPDLALAGMMGGMGGMAGMGGLAGMAGMAGMGGMTMPGMGGGAMAGAAGKGGGKSATNCIHWARGFCARGAACGYNHNFDAASVPTGDWMCPACGDHQFARNSSCRQCGGPKPPDAYGAMKGGGGAGGGASPYGGKDGGKGGMANPAGGVATVPDLTQTVPATPEEVEQFLAMCQVEEHASEMFRKMDSRGQRLVINRGMMSGARDPTAAFIGRLKSVNNIIRGGAVLSPGDWLCPGCGDTQFSRNTSCRRCGIEKPNSDGFLRDTVPASPVEVEQFLVLNPVEPHAAEKFRKMDPKAQRLVINKGGLEGARDPTAAFIGRLSAIDKIARGAVVLPPGDWLCPGCGDHQFSRNDSCRRCSTAKPAGAGAPGAAVAAAPAGMDLLQAQAALMSMTPEMQLIYAQMAMAQQQQLMG